MAESLAIIVALKFGKMFNYLVLYAGHPRQYEILQAIKAWVRGYNYVCKKLTDAQINKLVPKLSIHFAFHLLLAIYCNMGRLRFLRKASSPWEWLGSQARVRKTQEGPL